MLPSLRAPLAGSLLAILLTLPASAQDLVTVDSAVAAPAADPAPIDPLAIDLDVTPAGLPRLVMLRDPGSALVSLRLSVPFPGDVDASVAAPILLRLAETRLEGPAATTGVRFEAGHTSFGLSYSVTGPVSDLDQLGFLLRLATRRPRADEGFRRLRGEVEDALTRAGEVGDGRLEAELWARAEPELAPVAAVRDRLRTFGFADLLTVWDRTFAVDAMTVVAVGEAAAPSLLAVLDGLAPIGIEGGMLGPPPPSPPVRDRPDLLRSWFGVAWLQAPALDPRTAVAAALVSEHLRGQGPGFEAVVLVREARGHDVLAVLGGAYRERATAMRRTLLGLMTAVADPLEASRVQRAADALAMDLALQTRTPWGRAHFVSRFIEAGRAPSDAGRYLEALAGLDADAMRAWFGALAAASPVTAETGR